MYDSLSDALVALLNENGVALASLVGLFALSTLVAMDRWLHTRRELRNARERLNERDKTAGSLQDRLEALEGAVETVALGVERLNETELFAARLVAERRALDVPPKVASEPYKVITPH